LQDAGVGLVKSFLADLKAKNTYSDPKYYTRTKDELEKLINAKTMVEKSDLINELDRAVREVLINCR
jgi:hypothetical protein